MQAVFCLVEYDGPHRIHHCVSDLFAAMRGQAVHENGVGARLPQLELRSTGTAEKFWRASPLHAPDPCWSTHPCTQRQRRSTASCGSIRISITAPVWRRNLMRVSNDLRDWVHIPPDVAIRIFDPRQAAVSINECATLFPSPTYARHDLLQLSESFLQSEIVRQGLAWMFKIAERVDHRNASMFGHPLDSGCARMCARRCHPPSARRCARCRSVFHARPGGPGLIHEVGRSAQARHSCLKCQARAQGRFFEEHHHLLAGQCACGNLPDAPSSSRQMQYRLRPPSGRDRVIETRSVPAIPAWAMPRRRCCSVFSSWLLNVLTPSSWTVWPCELFDGALLEQRAPHPSARIT